MKQVPMTKLKDYILLFLKGLGMGAADVVPGVSGGTIAFITGIYEELLTSIKSVDQQAFLLLFSGKWKLLWEKINGKFLFTLLFGIFTSVLTLARLISYFLENHPIQLWSFFFGLVIISSLLVAKEIKQWNIVTVIALAVGIFIAYLITEFSPTETPDGLWFIFISGMLAICAMILPGISGSFIVLMLGKYAFLIDALNRRDLVIIAVFGMGCVVGLMIFSRILSWLLQKYHTIMIAVLSGFMIGSLNKIWPWKEVVATFTDRHGVVKTLEDNNILPTEYQELGNDPLVLHAILFCALGIGIVLLIERIAHYRKPLNA